jgi:predicted HNH restriction endonuclease
MRALILKTFSNIPLASPKFMMSGPKPCSFLLTLPGPIHSVTLVRLPTENDKRDETRLLKEGKAIQVSVNRFERNKTARELCLSKLGHVCIACDFDFGKKYGKIAQKFIHVHHIVPMSRVNKEYRVDPIHDLVPVCPNCHSVLHMPILP